MKRILFVDDDPFVADAYKDILQDAGYDLIAVESCGAAEHYLNEVALPDVVFIDYNIPDGLGTDLARDIHHRYPSLPLVMITVEEAAALEADRDLFHSILVKPVDPDVLLTFIDTL